MSFIFVMVILVAHFPLLDIVSWFVYALVSVGHHIGSLFIPKNSPVSIQSHSQSHHVLQSETRIFPSTSKNSNKTQCVCFVHWLFPQGLSHTAWSQLITGWLSLLSTDTHAVCCQLCGLWWVLKTSKTSPSWQVPQMPSFSSQVHIRV